MQLGFVTAIFPDLSLEQIMHFAAETGYDCVEVMCWPPSKAERRYAGVTHIDVLQLSDRQVAEIHALVKSTGVSISGLGYYPNPLTPDAAESDAVVEHLKKVISGARALGLNTVNSFVGRDWTKSVDDQWERFLSIWRPIIAHAEANHIRIGIENCPMLFGKNEWPGGKNLATSPAIWRRMFNDIPSDHFGLNFDPSHFVFQFIDPAPALMEFRGKLFHAHAKDARLDQWALNEYGVLANPALYHTPKLPGLGDVNWGKLFSVLTDVGYRGPVCVEVEDRAYEGSLELRKASLRQSATFLRNYIPRQG
jgi:sugar phosphate isomerase/epimerase